MISLKGVVGSVTERVSTTIVGVVKQWSISIDLESRDRDLMVDMRFNGEGEPPFKAGEAVTISVVRGHE